MEATEVVYTSFLPDINVPVKLIETSSNVEKSCPSSIRINKNYAEKQLSDFVDGTFPPDFVSDSLNKKWDGRVPGWRKEDAQELLGPVYNSKGVITIELGDVNENSNEKVISEKYACDQNFNRFLMGMR